MSKCTPTSAIRPIAGLLAGAVALVSLVNLAAAASVSSLNRVSFGDPFTGCTADKLANQPGTKYPATEIEPYVAANPLNPRGLIAVFQQDRFSDGAARGPGPTHEISRRSAWP